MSDYRVLFVTTPGEEVSANIARSLVGERLAACVNILPSIRSIYRWQGKIEDEPEQLLIIKSTARNVGSITARVLELHPYEVPEIVALKIDEGSPAYLQWLGSQVSGEEA